MKPTALLVFGVTLLASHAWASSPIQRAWMEDGAELLVQYTPGAPTRSLRIVFRAGAERDPAGKAGLAHVLEHLVLQTEMEPGAGSLWDDVQAAGGTLNAHTTAVATTYELDLPTDAFVPLARRFIEVVTDPPLDRVNLNRELGVIKSENLYSAVGGNPLDALLVGAIFPTEAPLRSVIGTDASRAAITLSDVQAFYRDQYSTRSTTVIFTGGTSLEEAKALLQESFRLPPNLPKEDSLIRLPVAMLPVEDAVRSPATAVVFGYGLDESLWPGCRKIAALLKLRLMLGLQVEQALAPAVRVQCLQERGNKLLLAFAFANSTEAVNLTDSLRSQMVSAISRPPSAREWSLVDDHIRREQQLLVSDPAGFANVLSGLASEPRPIGSELDLRVLEGGDDLTRGAVRNWMKKAFVAVREVRLSFSPYAGN